MGPGSQDRVLYQIISPAWIVAEGECERSQVWEQAEHLLTQPSRLTLQIGALGRASLLNEGELLRAGCRMDVAQSR